MSQRATASVSGVTRTISPKCAKHGSLTICTLDCLISYAICTLGCPLPCATAIDSSVRAMGVWHGEWGEWDGHDDENGLIVPSLFTCLAASTLGQHCDQLTVGAGGGGGGVYCLYDVARQVNQQLGL